MGRRQAALLGERLAKVPLDVVWHSPLPRAQATATMVADHLPGVPVLEAPELVDHVPPRPRARWDAVVVDGVLRRLRRRRPDDVSTLLVLNDQSHLPPELRWTGFSTTLP